MIIVAVAQGMAAGAWAGAVAVGVLDTEPAMIWGSACAGGFAIAALHNAIKAAI